MKSTRCICRTVAVLVVLVGTTAMVSAQGARTGDRPVPETFTATTTNMEPGVEGSPPSYLLRNPLISLRVFIPLISLPGLNSR